MSLSIMCFFSMVPCLGYASVRMCECVHECTCMHVHPAIRMYARLSPTSIGIVSAISRAVMMCCNRLRCHHRCRSGTGVYASNRALHSAPEEPASLGFYSGPHFLISAAFNSDQLGLVLVVYRFKSTSQSLLSMTVRAIF